MSKEEIENLIKYVIKQNSEIELITKIFNGYQTKTEISNQIGKYYRDSKQASKVYQKLKPLLKNKK